MIIGIAGYKGSGKTTAAKILQEIIPNSEIISFASPIKEMARVFLKNFVDNPDDYLFGSKKEEFIPSVNMTGRQIMQTIGTEWGRENVSESIWVKIVDKKVRQNPDLNFIIDDVRFINEMNYVLCMQGVFIKLNRESDTFDSHASENGVDLLDNTDLTFGNYFQLDNNGSIDDLRNELEDIMRRVNEYNHNDSFRKLIKDIYGDSYINNNRPFVIVNGDNAGKILVITKLKPTGASVKIFSPGANYNLTYRTNVLSEWVSETELRNMLGV